MKAPTTPHDGQAPPGSVAPATGPPSGEPAPDTGRPSNEPAPATGPPSGEAAQPRGGEDDPTHAPGKRRRTAHDWRHQLPFLVGLGCFVALALFNETRDFALWRNYALSGVLLGALAIYILWHSDVRVPAYIQWVVVGALLTHYGGGSLGSPDPYRMGLLGTHGINGAYHTFDWWDHLTHGVGIAASAMGFAYLLEVYQTRRGLQWSGAGLWIVTMLVALAAGVGVELYEFLGKTAFQTIDQGGYENTMRDLHFNFIGAAVGAGIAVTVNRARFRGAIQGQWGVLDPVPRESPWWMRTTPGMVGLITFCAVPAATALFLMTAFFTQEIPPDDLPLYDPALQTLTASAAVALVLAPMAGLMHRAHLRRTQEAA